MTFAGAQKEKLMINTDKKEIYRYLGYRRNVPEAEVIRITDSCLEQLQEAVTPRYIFRKYPVESVFEADAAAGTVPLLRIAGSEIRSTSLARNLR